ncbi:MAG: DEAD/DEAH box helicase family protein, partial [Acidimicrobiia bacterium]|nr:DEAD/DEAH box helicase family protein [Acidimicrobiia bacterium]
MLHASGWEVQNLKDYDPSKPGVALREYQNSKGSADYLLVVDRQPVGVIEAKKAEAGHHLTTVEDQTAKYITSQLKFFGEVDLYYGYESTGEVTRFTNFRDPKPRSREVFSFHRPETYKKWLSKEKSLRARLQSFPPLIKDGLRECQVTAIEDLELSLQENRPRALIQMATGAGKTYTAITAIYRLLKYAQAGKVLFLVDTKNLGEQADMEFQAFTPKDDQRKFTELYTVQR